MLKRTVLMAALLFTSAAVFAAEPSTPRVDQRQENQERRIEKGESSGALTEREAKNLEHKQDKLAKHEEKAKEDGKVTAAERGKLRAESRRNSRAIARKKHNDRRAPAGN
jgi:hypothetical protein